MSPVEDGQYEVWGKIPVLVTFTVKDGKVESVDDVWAYDTMFRYDEPNEDLEQLLESSDEMWPAWEWT